jgi:AraC-like DNA-binding protein
MLLTVPDRNDSIFSSLPMPLRCAGAALTISNRGFASATQDALHARRTASAVRTQEGCIEMHSLDIGNLKVVGGRTTPMQALMGETDQVAVILCGAGAITHKADGKQLMAIQNGIVTAPNHGGVLTMTHFAGITFCLEKERLKLAVKLLCGSQSWLNLDEPLASSPGENQVDSQWSKALFALFDAVNLFLQDDERLPAAMGLDDQIYRLVALGYVARANLMDQLGARVSSGAGGRGKSVLDELVSYIETHTAQPLCLTDLERRSHYSGRQLQNLFRERFDCTPMQFVKRQRLTAAMEQLQLATDDTTVTSIARGCGYHDASSFSNDFQRRFGVCPSAVLRSSRPKG